MTVQKKRKIEKRFLLSLFLLFFCLLSLRFGSVPLSKEEFLSGLLMKDGFETERTIIYSLRIPRIFACILAGTGLSLSGMLLQNVTGNDLAAPNVIGVNAGAGFSLLLLMFLFPSAFYLKSFAAFFGGIFALALVLSASGKASSQGSAIILSGVAVTALFSGGISFLVSLNSDLLFDYNHFSVGGVSGVSLDELKIPGMIIFLSLILCVLFHRKIDILCLGDSLASSLGVNVKLLRGLCLVLSGALAGAVVSFAGLLGFVGLIVPHIGRKLSSGETGDTIFYCVNLGSSLVLFADFLGRRLFAPAEIPVGTVLAFVGAPFFFYLVVKRR